MKTTIRRILEITLCLTLISTLTFAQGNKGQQGRQGQQGPPPIPTTEHVERMVTEMTEALSLTDSQQEQILGLFTEHFDEMKSLRSSKPDKETMDAKKAAFDAQIKKLLTTEQQTLFEEFQKNHRPPQQGMQGQGQQRQRK